MIFTSSRIYFLLLLVILKLNPVSNSQIIVNTFDKGNDYQNICQKETLSLILQDVDPNVDFFAENGNEKVRDICPFLKYTCCKDYQLERLASNLKKSFTFLSYRTEKLYDLFFTINEIQESTFTNLLNSINEQDIKCYNEKQITKYNSDLEKYKDNSSIKSHIESTKSSFIFSKKGLSEDFVLLKKFTLNYLKQMRNDNIERNKYYSNIICNMCSPIFSKYVKRNEKGKLTLELKVDTCNKLLKDKINFFSNVKIFKYVQKLLDLSFCSRKNSLAKKDYQSGPYQDFNVFVFDLNVFSMYKETYKGCISNKNSYISKDGKESSCLQSCKNSLNLFQVRVISMDKMLRAENEIRNMFIINTSTFDAAERIKQKLYLYSNFRKKFINMGILKLVGGEKSQENIDVVQTTLNSEYEFDNIDITVSYVTGLTFLLTDMNPIYYTSVSILINFALLFLIQLFNYD